MGLEASVLVQEVPGATEGKWSPLIIMGHSGGDVEQVKKAHSVTLGHRVGARMERTNLLQTAGAWELPQTMNSPIASGRGDAAQSLALHCCSSLVLGKAWALHSAQNRAGLAGDSDNRGRRSGLLWGHCLFLPLAHSST